MVISDNYCRLSDLKKVNECARRNRKLHVTTVIPYINIIILLFILILKVTFFPVVTVPTCIIRQSEFSGFKIIETIHCIVYSC